MTLGFFFWRQVYRPVAKGQGRNCRHAVLVAASAAALLVATPVAASGQIRAFTDGLGELTAAIAGTFGDEGGRIAPALDKMDAALAEWDRTIRLLESHVASESSRARPSEVFQMYLALSETYVARRRLSDALRTLEAASRVEPQRAEPHLLRGLVLDATGKSSEAGNAFRTAWSLDARNPLAAYYVFRHAVSAGATDDTRRARGAIALAYRDLLNSGSRTRTEPFVEIEPVYHSIADTLVLTPVAYQQGFAHLASGDYAEAISEFRRAASIDPLVVDPAVRSDPMMQGAAALRQGRLSDGRALFERATAVQGSSEARRMLGLTSWAEGQDDKSIEQLEIAIRMNPRDERARLALSRVLSSAGRESDAERALLETLRVLPDSAQAHWWLGSSYERANRLADARPEFDRAAGGLVSGHSELYAMIGRLAEQSADFTGSITARARAVNARPNDPSTRKSLAGAYRQQDRTDEEFVELVATVLIDPLDADAHAGIGHIHLNAGRYDDAVRALQRAVEVSPNHTEARYALATALLRTGRDQEAARELDRVAQEQRQTLAEQRRNLTLGVLKEEATLHAAEGRPDRAAALWQQVIEREPRQLSNHVAFASALAGAGQIDRAIEQYEIASTLGADPNVYRRLAALYAQVGRIEDAARVRAMYEKALR